MTTPSQSVPPVVRQTDSASTVMTIVSTMGLPPRHPLHRARDCHPQPRPGTSAHKPTLHP